MKLIDRILGRRPAAVHQTAPENVRYPAGLSIPALAELLCLLDEVSSEDMTRTELSLTKPASAEKVLGTVTAIATMRVWALGHKCAGRAAEAKHHAEFEAVTPDEASEARRQKERWRDLNAIAGWLFFLQAKDDIGDAAWDADAAGKVLDVRAGYRIVAVERTNPMMQFMGGLTGGAR